MNGRRVNAPNTCSFLIDRQNEDIFAFEAFGPRWQEHGRSVESFAIITRPAPSELESIHHRVPVLIDSAFYDARYLHLRQNSVSKPVYHNPTTERGIPSRFRNESNQVRHDDPLCESPRAEQQQ